jgi:hypothetical protein
LIYEIPIFSFCDSDSKVDATTNRTAKIITLHPTIFKIILFLSSGGFVSVNDKTGIPISIDFEGLNGGTEI